MTDLWSMPTGIFSTALFIQRQFYHVPVSSSAFSCSPMQLLISRQAVKTEWPTLRRKAQYTQGCNAEESRSTRRSQTEVSRSSYASGTGFISPMQTLQFVKKQQMLKKIQCDTCGVALCITPCVADFHSH